MYKVFILQSETTEKTAGGIFYFDAMFHSILKKTGIDFWSKSIQNYRFFYDVR